MALLHSYKHHHKIVIAYDGSGLYGWQKTFEGPSVQEALETVIQKITGEPISVEGCSRTDRGVHALAQVASFSTHKPIASYARFQRGINALLPPAIRLREASSVEASFHPGLSAFGKEYIYYVCQGPVQLPQHRLYSWHVPYELDLELMQKAASFFIGEHDFAAFTNTKKNEEYDSTIRRLDAFTIKLKDPQRLEFSLLGNQFLYKMVRNLVGTVIYIGRGKIALEELPLILQKKDRRLAGVTAPACGLWLKEIYYKEYVTEKRSLLVS